MQCTEGRSSLLIEASQLAFQDVAFFIHVKEGLPFLVHEQVAIGLCGNSGVKLSGLVLVKEDPGAVQGKLCVEDVADLQDAKVLILLFHESLKASKLACHNVAFVSHKVEELPNLEVSKALLGLLCGKIGSLLCGSLHGFFEIFVWRAAL